MIGWDYNPKEIQADCTHVPTEACEHILGVFTDIAELFERRPTRQRDGGRRHGCRHT